MAERSDTIVQRLGPVLALLSPSEIEQVRQEMVCAQEWARRLSANRGYKVHRRLVGVNLS